MAQRDNRLPIMGAWLAPPRSRPSGRCRVQPSTPLGPDQVNEPREARSGMEPNSAKSPPQVFFALQRGTIRGTAKSNRKFGKRYGPARHSFSGDRNSGPSSRTCLQPATAILFASCIRSSESRASPSGSMVSPRYRLGQDAHTCP
jgi:hypothetical protein